MFKLNRKKLRSYAVLLLTFLLLCIPMSGCKDSVKNLNPDTANVGKYPVTVNNIEITSQPKKIFVASGNLADVMLSMGCERYLVAATADCTQSDLDILPKLTISDTEAITNTAADLILTEPLDESTRQSLQSTNIPVLEIQLATTRDSYEGMYAQVGTALIGDGIGYDTGLDTAKNIFITLDTIARETHNDVVTTACYLYDTEGNAVTGDSFGTIILKSAGLINTFVNGSDNTYDVKTLSLSDPDIIFCDVGVKEEILSDTRFADFSAVKNGKVYEVERMYMDWLGRSTVVQGATKIASLAFPELFDEFTPSAPDAVSKINDEVSNSMADEISILESHASSASSASSESSESSTSSDLIDYDTLEEGDDGDEVYEIQERLSELGFLEVEYDGVYGSVTAEAVKAFQTKNGLSATGIADSATQNKLFSADAKAK